AGDRADRRRARRRHARRALAERVLDRLLRQDRGRPDGAGGVAAVRLRLDRRQPAAVGLRRPPRDEGRLMAEKTEKATPKKRDEALAKGQVAKSMDLNGAVVLMASLFALSAFGPRMLNEMETAMLTVIQMVSRPEVVDQKGVGSLFMLIGKHVALGAAPVVAVCMVSGVIINVIQVKPRIKRKVLKPDPKRLNPVSGLKNLFSPNSLVELVKNLIKI